MNELRAENSMSSLQLYFPIYFPIQVNADVFVGLCEISLSYPREVKTIQNIKRNENIFTVQVHINPRDFFGRFFICIFRFVYLILRWIF